MRKLGTLNVVGTLTSVVHATQEEASPHLDGEYDEGAFHYPTSTIYVRAYTEDGDLPLNPSAAFATTVHEAVHAAFYVAGARNILREACPHLCREAREALEERLVLALAPCLVTALPGLNDVASALAGSDAK